MGEKMAIWRTKKPATKQKIVSDLEESGIKKGDTIIFHASMSKAHWICGGPVTVILALQELVGETGNIVMPAQTGQLSDPEKWENPPVPESWWKIIRRETPPFDPLVTPTRGMGVIAETFRTMPDVERSFHPYHSFCAWGKDKKQILANQPLAKSMGDESPLGKMYQLDAKIILFGVDNNNNTSLHLAEERSNAFPLIENQAAFLKNGEIIWEKYQEIDYNSDVFIALGRAYEKERDFQPTTIIGAPTKIYDMRDLVDFGTKYFQTKNH
ncbi:aminoglycoside N(3)-acetyltransferase [Listeria monocytogenes]|uniref:aminoglycoside N(3)-acetyltransferase n=1 Tax=Listeria monocytogenes TaxID=1639 RepID=UPI0005447DD9|nr:AAC(3) family N-acetyltransferase [Listeria monocytogenes]EAC5142708.1 AAC(3) family N-acetyltransferase [Listeria monocytogenes]EAC5142799.1 AAC(3) family N-acetyltransferase [Listeria monocytogenes]EAC7687390.1 AAC(3) family N-acetyltransferase [Listeria monocytogenes]EAC7687481.1 AAC(3) family N-acetyltransferase [Listeria monocytogenes]EAC7907595.1 AAC(3) family N-acetyltransferase [Listeria monocytogenes]